VPTLVLASARGRLMGRIPTVRLPGRLYWVAGIAGPAAAGTEVRWFVHDGQSGIGSKAWLP